MATIDNLTDQLLSNVFRNLVNLNDFRNCRLVSQKWKSIVMTACRNNFHVVFPLTDTTLYTANELKDALVSFDVYSFTGKGNKTVTWSTSGIEPLMKTTEWLQFSGSEISTGEFQKIMGLANDSLKTLSLKSINKNLMLPLLQWQKPLCALRKLSIGYYSSDNNYYNPNQNQNPFSALTSTLEKWISLDCRVQLPVLESLSLFHGTPAYYYYGNNIASEDLFRRYLAIANLLLKYKRTLKDVQIEGVFSYVNMYQPSIFQPQWTEMQLGLESLDELNLNRLKVSTIICNGNGPSFQEIELFGRPKNLKNILFNNLICHRDSGLILMQTLISLNNENGRYLTSIKINLNLSEWEFQDPTLAISLGALRECRNLKALWLIVGTPRFFGRLSVRNLELLPTGISILRIQNTEPEQNHNYLMGQAYYNHQTELFMSQEMLLNQQQIRWIVDNLRGLESFWMSLLIPETANAENNENDDDIPADQVDDEQPQPIEQAEVDRLVNINLETFRDLIALPRMKNLQLKMMKARALAACIRHYQRQPVHWTGVGTSLKALRGYSDLLDAAGYNTSTTTSPHFRANHIFGFAKLTSQRN